MGGDERRPTRAKSWLVASAGPSISSKTQVDRAGKGGETRCRKAKYELAVKQTEIIGQGTRGAARKPTASRPWPLSRWLNSQGVQHDEREIPQNPAAPTMASTTQRLATMQ